MQRPTLGRPFVAGLYGLVAFASSTLAVRAQDSTSKTPPGLPGDALDPHLAVEQENDYVSDLTPFASSWSHTFGVTPISKASADFSPAPAFFNAQLSAQALSVDQLVGVPFARDSYGYWNAPGRGVNNNPSVNDPPSATIDTSAAVGNQLAFTFGEFSEGNGISFNNIVSGVINYDTDVPSRLYVSRVAAAVNSPDWNCNLSQYGIGGVDSAGYVQVRGDGVGSGPCLAMTELLGSNYFRVNTLGRNTAVANVISNTGGSDAGSTVRLLQNTTMCSNGFSHTHSPATCIPSSVTGGLPITIGSAFGCPPATSIGQFVYGSSMPTSSSTAHLNGADDARGTISYSKRTFPTLFGAGATRGTAAIISRVGSTDNRIQVWGLDVSGNPLSALSLPMPAVLTDNDDGWPSNTLGAGQPEFGMFGSQVAFRGGNGQLAVGRDLAGNLIAAGTADHPTTTSNGHENNMIAVARVTPGGSVTWTVAAYNGASTPGKAILDGPNGSTIGRLITLGALTGGVTPGPSMSPPMIDSIGNIYFLSPIELTGGDLAVGLLRAVYDRPSFSYQLELLLSSGDVLHGLNSDTDYQIRFVPIADSNSISSGTAFSGNICQDAFNGINPSTLPAGAAETLGGLIFSASIIYDVDGSGTFQTLTENPATGDEEYSVLLLVAPSADCNDNGVPDDIDIANGTSGDLNGDGIPDECGAGTSFCFGDGSGIACPCGNLGGPGEGCANSSGSGGVLVANGTASVTADDLVFNASNLLPNQPALLFAGENAINGGSGTVFGDGHRCAGLNVVRLGVRVPNASGQASWGPGLAAQAGWMAGDTRYFQAWYRDPNPPNGSPCGNAFNLSHGLQVDFIQ